MGKLPPKAYKNLSFLNSSEARMIRILSEYLEPRVRFTKHDVENTIVMFGSARTLPRESALEALKSAKNKHKKTPNPDNALAVKMAEKRVELSQYYEDCRELAKMLTEWSIKRGNGENSYYIASGGGPGMMEAANRGASEADGGESVGLNISLPMEQGCNPYITDDLNFEFHYFFMRKFWFIYLAKAIVAYPGGFGTLDELFEVLTLIQTRKVNKKLPVVLYGKEYWHNLINFDALVENMMINKEDMDLIYFAESNQDAFDYLTSHLNGDSE
ncbi:MAG: LOG family protein [Calditrichaeota bacterium]|nr:LOG family protein [Calditrichota bacterium]MCB0267708.1 LOG family protein [Calditrichota bacterium]MCB9068434.1 LOG family protein [Calditrichia bacterium]